MLLRVASITSRSTCSGGGGSHARERTTEGSEVNEPFRPTDSIGRLCANGSGAESRCSNGKSSTSTRRAACASSRAISLCFFDLENLHAAESALYIARNPQLRNPGRP
jgi:hypothetical protein